MRLRLPIPYAARMRMTVLICVAMCGPAFAQAPAAPAQAAPASATASAAARAPVAAQPPAPPTPAVSGLPPDAPKIVINGGVYSEDRSVRAAIVNGNVVHEGADLGSGVVLQEIRPAGVVLAFHGNRYNIVY